MLVHHDLLVSLGCDLRVDRLDEPMIVAFQRLAQYNESRFVPRCEQLVEQMPSTVLGRLGAEDLSTNTAPRWRNSNAACNYVC